MACCAPAPFATQIYFMIVIVFGFIGTLGLILLRLRWRNFNKMGKQAVKKFANFSHCVILIETAQNPDFQIYRNYLAQSRIGVYELVRARLFAALLPNLFSTTKGGS